VRVLIIEAGPDGRHDAGIVIPGRKGSTLGGQYDWNLTTVPQPGANDRVFAQNRGKVLGGSSALNLMTWDRTSIAELDAWEQTLGNTGWNWSSLYAAMLKAETFQPSSLYGEEGVGKTGPIGTLINRIIPRHQRTWTPTLLNLGLAENRESLNGHPIGVSTQPSNVHPNYTRSYAPDYLRLAKANLVLKLETRVAKINFAGTTATGVTLEDGVIITACREVILSAGSLQSPALLELSGIGDATLLSSLSIPVVKELPAVGQNLQDHIRIQASFQLQPEYHSFDALKNTSRAAIELSQYHAGNTSFYDYTASGYAYVPWTTVSPATAARLESLVQNDTSLTSPIDQLKRSYLSPPLSHTVPQVEVIFSDGYTGLQGYPPPTSPLHGMHTFTLIGVVQHPLSRGSVHITSRNTSQPPAIDPHYLSHPYDLSATTALARFLRTVAQTPPLRATWHTEYEPGVAVHTDAHWEAYARANTLSIYHPVGTCAMLPVADGGVVDTQLRVHGTRGLRVVDASVIPLLPSAHLQTLVYGIAERAAEMVVEAHQ